MSKLASSIQIGSYQLLERIGEGGTSHVHRARGKDGAMVAIKLLAPGFELDEPTARARFEREIDALSAVDHRGVLPLLDSGVDAELGPFLVTPLITGKHLRELLAGVRLPPEGGLLILRALASAAAALHAAGLVHRDLKPENIMAHADGHLVLFDLGLAHRSGQSRYTDEGHVVGSVPYMAPEQVEGREVCGAADVWALAVLTYEAMVGVRPFARERSAEEAAAILVGRFPAASAADRRVGPGLDALLADCLLADPSGRPSAAALEARASELVDWTDDPAAELAALVANPASYEKRVRRFRVARLAMEAREQLAAEQTFAALRTIDRGLAYHPEGPEEKELLELADTAHQSHGVTAPVIDGGAMPTKAGGRSRLAVGIAAAVLAIVGAAIALALSQSDSQPVGASQPPASVMTFHNPETGGEPPDKAMELVGDFIEVFKNGIELSKTADLHTALAEANASGLASSGAALEGVEALVPGQLGNQDPTRPLDLAAADGEPLVPRSLLGTADPAAVIADFDRRAGAQPGNADLAVGRALVYLAAGKTEHGLAQLDALVSSHAGAAAVWSARGFIELRRGNWLEAEVALGRAIELNSTDAQSFRNRGILRSRRGRTRDAYLDLVRALALAPADREALRELAGIYRRAGRQAAAAELSRRASKP